MPETTPLTTVDELFAVLADDGHRAEAIRVEPISFSAHGLQCAALLAQRFPDDIGLQVAGLVHDVGHVEAPDRPDVHGRVGGAMVEPLLGARVAHLVELHVPAKRYLLSTDPEYAERLSPTSEWTSALQGGPLAGRELDAFLAHPEAATSIALRRADDEAKVPGREVASLEAWRPVVDAWSRSI